MIEIEQVESGQFVVVGAPMDEGVSYRPGARFGPRAIRLADDGGGDPGDRYHLDLGIHPMQVLQVVDAGDLPVVPGDPQTNLTLLQQAVEQIATRGGTPLVLGGDHSVAGATIRGASTVSDRSLHVVQFDAHTDTAPPGPGRPPWSHGSQFWHLITEEVIRGQDLSQVGLRGWWPGPDGLAWGAAHGIRAWTARQVRKRGIRELVEQVLDGVAEDVGLWFSIDIDVLDPAFAPGTGSPEPGGLASWELLDLVSELALERDVLGLEVVEVAPAYDSAEITALTGHRVLLEALSAMAVRASR